MVLIYALVRETTEDEYVLENQLCPGVEFLKNEQDSGPTYLLNKHFNFAMKNNKELVTAIHKSKFLRLSIGQWKLLKIGQSYSTVNNAFIPAVPNP